MPDRKMQTLARLHRVRMVERQDALGRLAQAATEEARSRKLSTHAQNLLDQYHVQRGTGDGLSLSTLHAFRQQMREVAASSSDMSSRAEVAVDDAGKAFARTSKRLEQTSERLVDAKRSQARRIATDDQLAHGLQRSKQSIREHNARKTTNRN